MEKPDQARGRQPDDNATGPARESVCPLRGDREKVSAAIRSLIAQRSIVPPLSKEELLLVADESLLAAGLPGQFRDYAAVAVHNELWRPSLGGIPYSRRLLLLLKCLRHKDRCQGKLDEFGLVCARCGSCIIDEIHAEAEDLGYVIMVAEGSPLVMALIESGQVEAVVGVSCLAVLENVFPYMEAAAVPGLAIPLLRDGCEDTEVDMESVWDAIYLNSSSPVPRLNLEELRSRVKDCFTPAALDTLMGPAEGDTERIARRWLAGTGKRWRPFLAAAVHQALQEDPRESLPPSLKKLLVAVESFHKASLIHDDIEDGDEERYGRKTLHAAFGVPAALNAGDLLLGEGYRLIGVLDCPSDRIAEMLRNAAAGHRTLCLGQGAELFWRRRREPLSSREVLAIFRRKTAPAFEVALHLGALYAGADSDLLHRLHRYSEALGVAYQIRDDLLDSGFAADGGEAADPEALGPSLFLALAWERAAGEDREAVETFWRSEKPDAAARSHVLGIMKRLGLPDLVRSQLDVYRREAVEAVSALDNVNLKIVLHRVMGKIFSDLSMMGCCNDHQARNASLRESGENRSG